MIRRTVEFAAECVMVGTVLAVVPFAVVFAAAAIVRGGLEEPKKPLEKPETARARVSNGKGAWAP